jgi:hypothetical protein
MTRTALALSLTLSLTLSLAATACSSGDVAVGSSQQAVKKTPSGGATGNGSTCSWDDAVSTSGGGAIATPSPSATYKVGDTFKSPDGCNECSCTAQGIACTLRACAPAAGGACTYGGTSYAAGAAFPSTDNCNTCSCQANGDVLCTERACAPASTCKKTGCSGELCSDQDVASGCLWTAAFACYQTATCERQASGQCGFTETPQLTQCLATAK